MSIKSSTPQAGWTRHDIAAAIRNAGYTQGALDQKLGLTKGSVTRSLGTPYPRVDVKLAEFLGKSLHELWPSRYDPNGDRIGLLRKRRKAEPATAPA